MAWNTKQLGGGGKTLVVRSLNGLFFIPNIYMYLAWHFYHVVIKNTGATEPKGGGAKWRVEWGIGIPKYILFTRGIQWTGSNYIEFFASENVLHLLLMGFSLFSAVNMCICILRLQYF